MKLLLILVALFASSQAAPQYGPVGGQQGDGTGPQQQRAPAAPARTKCRTEYTTIWDTEYVETENQVCTTVYVNECNTLYKKQCQNVPREACTTVNDRQCSTVYRDVCTNKFRTEYEDYTETECTTEHKEDCEYHWEGQGEAKVWVPIPGTCKSNPYNTCVDVKKQRERQVPYPDCRKVPEEKCVDVPKKECTTVQEEKCRSEPYQKCDQIPKKECNNVHKKVPNRISKRIPKKVCDDGSGTSYGHGGSEEEFGSGSIAVRSGSDAIQFA